MAERVSARLTPGAQGRRFGLTLGIAFLALAAIAAWRGRVMPSSAFGIAGVLLLVAGIVAPLWLLPIERAWMTFAAAISKVTTPIFMGILWFLVITPTGLIRRSLGKNTLKRQRQASSFWHQRQPGARQGNPERQF